MPTAGPENYLESLKGFLGRQGLILDHCGSKIPDSLNSQENTQLLVQFFFVFVSFCSLVAVVAFIVFLSFILFISF